MSIHALSFSWAAFLWPTRIFIDLLWDAVSNNVFRQYRQEKFKPVWFIRKICSGGGNYVKAISPWTIDYICFSDHVLLVYFQLLRSRMLREFSNNKFFMKFSHMYFLWKKKTLSMVLHWNRSPTSKRFLSRWMIKRTKLVGFLLGNRISGSVGILMFSNEGLTFTLKHYCHQAFMHYMKIVQAYSSNRYSGTKLQCGQINIRVRFVIRTSSYEYIEE